MSTSPSSSVRPARFLARLGPCSLAVGLLAAVTTVTGVAPSAEGQIFREEFNGPAGRSLANNWTTETQFQGRGKFSSSGWVNGKGQGSISVSTFNPQAPGSFNQALIKTKRTFIPRPGRVLDFEARVQVWGQNQRGIVFGFFLYNQFGSNPLRSDEADFEWLTNKTANRGSDNILVSTWSDWNRDNPQYGINQSPTNGTQLSVEKGLGADVGGFRTYIMRWGFGKLEFFLVQPDGKWKYIHGFYGGQVPNGAQRLFFNAWVPDSSWTQAFDGRFNATRNRAQNKYYGMNVDYVRVFDRPNPR